MRNKENKMFNYYQALLLYKLREKEILKKAELRRLINESRATKKKLNKKPGLWESLLQRTGHLFISLGTKLKKGMQIIHNLPKVLI